MVCGEELTDLTISESGDGREHRYIKYDSEDFQEKITEVHGVDDDLVQDVIQGLEREDEEFVKYLTKGIVEEEMKNLLSRGMVPHLRGSAETKEVEMQSLSLLKTQSSGVGTTSLLILLQALQSGLKKNKFQEKKQLQTLVDQESKNLLRSGLYLHQETQTEIQEDQDQYLSLLEASGIGVRGAGGK